jgi:hypothetical protein
MAHEVLEPTCCVVGEASDDFARFPASRNLHPGYSVRVTAIFDGTRYAAGAVDAK